MKKLLFTFSFFIFSLSLIVSCGNHSNSQSQGIQKKDNYDFDAANYKYNTQKELVTAFINTLAAHDTAGTQQYLITKEVISYAATLIDKQDTIPVEKKVAQATDELNHKMKAVWGHTIGNLVKMMNDDNVDLASSTITIDTMASEPFKGCNAILHSSAVVRILTKDQQYHKLNVYSLLRIKGKWFILGPKWDWDGHAVHNRG